MASSQRKSENEMQSHSQVNAGKLCRLEQEPLSKKFSTKSEPKERKRPLYKDARSWLAQFSGWRGGFLACIAVTAIVLLLNVMLAIVAVTTWDPVNGIATIYTGNCSVSSRWTMAMHLLINFLSSLLLGASNYCMQRLAAPTRAEIDKAHRRKKWLDIGMPSIRNLLSISKGRVVLWALIGLSSVPLHFLYNSVIFGTVGTNGFEFLAVQPDFLTVRIDSSNKTFVDSDWSPDYYAAIQDLVLDGGYMNRTRFENITGAECISRYSAEFIASGVGLGVMSSTRPVWIGGINVKGLIAQPLTSFRKYQTGGFFAEDFAYCLSLKVPSKCKVELSQNILYAVIVCNAVKLVAMVMILWRWNRRTIVTVGDAIESFIEQPDCTTKDCCLMAKDTVAKIWHRPNVKFHQRFHPRAREAWFRAVSTGQWVASIILYLITIGFAIFFAYSSSKTEFYNRQKKTGGFGRVSADYLIHIESLQGKDNISLHILLANLPQAIISFVYLTYNALFTCMCANREWSRYAIKRAVLRVTIPSPTQRSSYFIQLPYIYSVPLLLASALLHWFISQSIFLVRIITYYERRDTVAADEDILTGVGYSEDAIYTSLGWGSALVLFCLVFAGVRTFPKGMPIGGTNSAVISAACHVRDGIEGPTKTQDDISHRPLQWGVTIEGSNDVVGHCSFSSSEVQRPIVGHLYAGSAAKMKLS
ncbi:hypothetical protein DM02DRAFT_669382 [Periconia macrospinosa]|uniref:DUF6536 domain-containing protein n=1 Tax=Periconia macrospinosa TaxID=97972 RepID=A0A2V1E3H8_9PLEO|nr:hypothetical protein DM02DRAFT_669382 [Periconia macrospinosa]